MRTDFFERRKSDDPHAEREDYGKGNSMYRVYRQSAVQVITGNVPLTADSVPQAREVCEQAFGQGQPHIVVDLSEVALIDGAGLELLLDVRDRCLQCGGTVHLAAPNVLCRDILQATELASEFVIFTSVNAAVGSFAQ